MESYGKILLYIVLASSFVGIGFFLNYLLAPRKPNPEKNSTYECGEESQEQGAIQFNLRFYLIGLIFLIFEVEILFL
ncbi:MAG: NADH-quinone oxidoreductase subunit A, partial [Bacteroidota bacterium]